MTKDQYIERFGQDAWEALPDCETCDGQGWLYDEEFGGTKCCENCDDTGKVIPGNDGTTPNAGECC